MVIDRASWRLWAAVALMLACQPASAQEFVLAQSEASNPAASLCDVDLFLAPPRCPLYIRGEGLALRRDVDGATDVATLNGPDILALSTRDLDLPFKAGPRVLVGHTFADSPYQVEFSAFWLDDWDDSAAVRDATTNTFGVAGNLFSPFGGFGAAPIVGLDYNDFVSIREYSRTQNMELHLRRLLSSYERLTASFIIGARHTLIRERFDYESHTNWPFGITNSVRTRTRNELYGAQIGGLFEFFVEQQWWINTELKGAICNNAAGQDTLYTSTAGPGGFFGRSQNGTSFIGDVAVTVVCRPASRLAVRIGYQAIWVTGVAIAAENMNPNIDMLTSGPAQINHRGTVVYHGPHAGLELAW